MMSSSEKLSQRGGAALRLQDTGGSLWHGWIIVVITTIVKRHICLDALRECPRSYPFRFKGLASLH
jgi:hypothetical protein